MKLKKKIYLLKLQKHTQNIKKIKLTYLSDSRMFKKT